MARAQARHRDAEILHAYRDLLAIDPFDLDAIHGLAGYVEPAAFAPTHDANTAQIASELHVAILAALDPSNPFTPEVLRELRHLDAVSDVVLDSPDDAVAQAIASCGRLDDIGFELLRRIAAWRIQHHDVDRAQTVLEASRRCAGHRLEGATDLGALLLSRGRAREAVRLFREAYDNSPNDISRARDYGGALLAAGNPREALRVFEKLRDAEPENPERDLDLARAAIEVRNFAKAEESARRATMAGDAIKVQAFFLLGTALAAEQRTHDAAQAFREVLRIHPEDIRARDALHRTGEAEAEVVAPTTN